MNRKVIFAVTLVMTLALGLVLTGCDNGNNPGNNPGTTGDPNTGGGGLTGTLHISNTSTGAAISSAATGTQLYAVYTGTLPQNQYLINYTWYKEGTQVYQSGTAYYAPTAAGSYTVKVTTNYGNSVTSAAVTVTASSNTIPPALLARWYPTQYLANEDASPYLSTYEFKSNGTVVTSGVTSYSITVTGNAIRATYMGVVVGGCDFAITGTQMTISNVTDGTVTLGSVFTAGTYYKKATP